MTPDTFGRVQKLLVDRDGADPAAVRELLRSRTVILTCGHEVASSPTLQAAVLTAANVASRCLPGTVRLDLAGVDASLCVPWPSASTLTQAVADIAPPADDAGTGGEVRIVFGTRPDCRTGLQVTFDGWSAVVAPQSMGIRLPEQHRCVLAGVLGGALAVGEVFLDLTGVAIEASRRAIGLSLWRPDLDWGASEAIGVPLEYLPAEFWSLGLGHLGQAYLWCIGLLPYSRQSEAKAILNDFDTIVSANLDTGLLTYPAHLGRLKTRVACGWFEGLGFRPRLVERHFDKRTVRGPDEPALALCGFDGRGPRHLLDSSGFDRVIECGLGNTAADFDVLDFHTLGSPTTPAAELWPTTSGAAADVSEGEVLKNPFYRSIRERSGCGHMQLAGVSVAVPFMGVTAGALVVAEALRMLHAGERYQHIRLQLRCPREGRAHAVPGGYRGRQVPRFGFQCVQAMA
jgi:hypothetical protein